MITRTAAMPLRRILFPFLALLIALSIVLACALLPFIPSWATFQAITCSFALVGSIAASAWLTRGIWLQTKERLSNAFRVILTAASGFLMAACCCFAAFLCLFVLTGGIFAPTFSHQVEFPEYNTTVYVYDNSFLDLSTLFTVRRSSLPFMHSIGTYFDVAAHEIHFTRAGEWAVCEPFKLHLPTGFVKSADNQIAF